MLEAIGIFFIALIIFVVGCIRGEQMEQERGKRLANTGKPFYTIDGVDYYLCSENHAVIKWHMKK